MSETKTDTIYKKLANILLECQDELNKQMSNEEDWQELNHNYRRYLRMEAFEMINDHIGFKHWTKQKELTEEVMEQLRIECIDMIHFFLSEDLQRSYMEEDYISCVGEFLIIVDAIEKSPKGEDYLNPTKKGFRVFLLNRIDGLINNSYAEPSVFIRLLAVVCVYCGLTVQSILHLYLTKFTLNKFRQAHGDREGKYNRYWSGVEDNVCTMRLANTLTQMPLDCETDVKAYMNILYGLLEEEYVSCNH